MPEWLVQLNGDRFDLEDMRELFTASDLRVTEESGTFYLHSTEFVRLGSDNEVRERGKALIKLINGAMKLYRPDASDISEAGVTRVRDDGKRDYFLFAEAGNYRLRGTKLKATVTVDSPTGAKSIVGQPSIPELLVEKSKKYQVVADALHFLREDTWIGLYKTFELIRDDVGGVHKLDKTGWTTQSDIKRFTQTAQSRRALGDSARHASHKYKPPKIPMSLEEARSLIRSLLSNWLNTKH